MTNFINCEHKLSIHYGQTPNNFLKIKSADANPRCSLVHNWLNQSRALYRSQNGMQVVFEN